MSHLTAFDFFLAFASVVVFPVISAIWWVRPPYRRHKRKPSGWSPIIRNVVVVAAILFAWHWEGRPYALLGLQLPIPFWGWVGFGLDLLLIAYFVLGWPPEWPRDQLEAALKEIDANPGLPKTQSEFHLFQLTIVIGAIGEEILFRGFLFWALPPIFGIWGTAIITAVAFALGHLYQGWKGLVESAAVSLVYAFAYVLTESLWWLILAHMIKNFGVAFYAWRIRCDALAAEQTTQNK